MLHAHRKDSIERIFAETFQKVDAGMAQNNIQSEGCTAAFVFMQKEIVDSTEVVKIYSANCGDARSVLVFVFFPYAFYFLFRVSRSGKGLRLSFDHKPTLKEEVARIQNAGGFVSMGRVNGLQLVTLAINIVFF